MIISTLLNHQWKAATRSPIWKKNLAVNLILGLFITYLLLVFALLGFFLKEILQETFPEHSPFVAANGFLLYYFISDFFLRFYFQDLPVFSIAPYLHLPLRKRKIIHYLLGKSLLNFFNFFPFLIFLPLFFRVVLPTQNLWGALAWLTALTAWVCFNNFLTLYLKRKTLQNIRFFAIFLSIYLIIALLEILEIPLRTPSAVLFSFISQNPWLALLFLPLPPFAYRLNYQFLKNNAYLEEILEKKQATRTLAFTNTAFLERFGKIGDYINLEIKLIWRNKRTKSVAQMSVFLLFYGLIFYPQASYTQNYLWIIFVGTFVTGAFMINYGQFILAWESAYFDGILTKNIDLRRYFAAKFWLMAAVATVFFLLSLLYGFFGTHIIIIHTAAFLYNIGVNTFILLYFSTYNRKKIDLDKKATFNAQGSSIKQYLIAIPMLLFPILIFLPFNLLDLKNMGIVVLCAFSLLSLICAKFWFTLIVRKFISQKHKIAEGFRL